MSATGADRGPGVVDRGIMTTTAPARAETGVAPFAARPVWLIAAAVGIVLTAVSGRYGWFGDELYFVAAGHHLDWGYADQPPMLPLLALLMDTLAPGHVWALRIPSTLATVAAVVLAALTARELGGARKAQVIAAATLAVSPGFLANGHLLATSTFDPILWTLLTWLLVRWLRTRADSLLVWAGVATAFALQVKFLVVGFWAVALLALLICGPREILRRPALWLGGAIAVVATVPTLLWQAANGWPQLEMGRVIAAEQVYAGGMLGFLPIGVFSAGLVVGSVLGIHGLGRLLRHPLYRWLGITALGTAVLFMVTGGRPYYIAGVFPLLWAASAVAIEAGTAQRWWRWVATWPMYALTVVGLGFANVLPISPIASHADRPLAVGNFQRDEIGWPEMVADVERVAPPGAIVVGESYWSSSAVEVLSELPAYGYSRGPAYWGPPPEADTPVVFVGDPAEIGRYFGEVRQVGVLDNDRRVANLSQGTPILLLEGRNAPWAEIWAEIRRL
ncbi:glycosyltransferase family 39 protein [Pseudonocardia pini]|uniref:glycosyltransferase family 39 protein n=1 Tax=Pseudonocardia pini TaxID=2758030 RepID=UPI0028A60CC8|nr:glycosyltransferase family 39 protein [Pseudonocardia pini]